MIRINYTREMELQDELWGIHEENHETMRRLFKELYRDAVSKGYTGGMSTCLHDGIMIAEVYKTDEDRRMGEVFIASRCRPLRFFLEREVNKPKDSEESLRDRVQGSLIRQGRGDTTLKELEEIMQIFRGELLETMIEENLDLTDLDRWVALEQLLGHILDYKAFKDIGRAMYENDIEVLEID